MINQNFKVGDKVRIVQDIPYVVSKYAGKIGVIKNVFRDPYYLYPYQIHFTDEDDEDFENFTADEISLNLKEQTVYHPRLVPKHKSHAKV